MPKRIAATTTLISLFALLYFGIAMLRPVEETRSLAVWLDDWIPFVPSAVYVYAWVYTGALLPLFTVRSDALFERVVWAYSLVFAICSASFILFPVSAMALRPPLPPLADPSFTEWSIRLLYALDPPTNLFPSLHVAIAFCAAMASWKSNRRYGHFVFPWVLAISISTLLTKQHYVVDVVVGVAVGILALQVCTRRLVARADEISTFPPLAAPLVLHCAFVLVFYAAFTVSTSWTG
ncbi:MAG: phosphatase PAP2 family protein [Deltaproteobacteria bacterium]|nr:phosphatase PAP2 family protein [Deltaproteobacteria bacterium]